jgi:hypothetical protein
MGTFQRAYLEARMANMPTTLSLSIDDFSGCVFIFKEENLSQGFYGTSGSPTVKKTVVEENKAPPVRSSSPSLLTPDPLS